MKNNVRRTFRPTLDALEDRLVPSFQWGEVGSPDFAAALTSFQWGIGRGGVDAALTAVHLDLPATFNQRGTSNIVGTQEQPALALSSFQWGVGRGIDVAVLTGAQPVAAGSQSQNNLMQMGAATAASDPAVVLHRVPDHSVASPTVAVSPDIKFVYGVLGV